MEVGVDCLYSFLKQSILEGFGSWHKVQPVSVCKNTHRVEKLEIAFVVHKKLSAGFLKKAAGVNLAALVGMANKTMMVDTIFYAIF